MAEVHEVIGKLY